MPVIPEEKTIMEASAVQSLSKERNIPILPITAGEALRDFNEEEAPGE